MSIKFVVDFQREKQKRIKRHSYTLPTHFSIVKCACVLLPHFIHDFFCFAYSFTIIFSLFLLSHSHSRRYKEQNFFCICIFIFENFSTSVFGRVWCLEWNFSLILFIFLVALSTRCDMTYKMMMSI